MIEKLYLLAADISTDQYQTNLPHASASHENLQNILQIVFGILGALAVLFIVLGGLRFITAQGNPQETSKARNTLVYAVVGLLIAISAEAIVSLVLGHL
jgi:uncharacterized membrane protein YidH (DUF202 family)